MQLSLLQRQLILTAMDAAAAPGEQATAASMFFRELRKTYHDGYALLADLAEFSNATVAPSAPAPSPCYSTVRMPFGKHKGRQLAEIDAAYLLWILDNVTTLSSSLKRAIEGHLQAEYYAN